MATYYLEGVTAVELEYLRSGAIRGATVDRDWRDGTANVCVETDGEDPLLEWCEGQNIAVMLL